MKAHNRLSDDYVREYVIANSDCELLKIEHVKKVKYLDLKCSCGNHFRTRWVSFKGNKNMKPKITCRECTNKSMSKKFSLDNDKYIAEKKRLGIEIEHIEECKGSHNPIKHICPYCSNIFESTPNNILTKKSTKCRPCADKILGIKRMHDKKHVSETLKERDLVWLDGIYNNKNSQLKVLCSCNEHTFTRKYEYIMQGFDRCEYCSNQLSKPVTEIRKILDSKNIHYSTEKTFENLKFIKPLRFDFYIKDTILVEYHGEQHYKSNTFYDDSSLFMRDSIKENYANTNKIPLIIIPYTLKRNLKSIIEHIIIDNNIKDLISTYGYIIDFHKITYGFKEGA